MASLHLLHNIVSIWFQFISIVFCFPRKPKPDLLPTFHLVVPAKSLPTLTETITPAGETDSQIDVWEKDKARFMRNPSLKRSSLPPHDRRERNQRRRVRICSKGYGGVPRPIPLANSSPQPGAREWASLGINTSEFLLPSSSSLCEGSENSRSSPGPSSICPISETTPSDPAVDPHPDISASDIVVISPSCDTVFPSPSANRQDSPTIDDKMSTNENSLCASPSFSASQHPLLLARNSYAVNPLSAVCGHLWDPTPAVSLRSVAIPRLTESVTTSTGKWETGVSYSDLFGYSIYGDRTSGFDSIFTSHRSVGSDEGDTTVSAAHDGPLDCPSMIPALASRDSLSLAANPFESSVAPSSASPFGPALLANNLPTFVDTSSRPIVGKNMRLFNSTSNARDRSSQVEEEELSSFECTEEELANLVMSCE